MTYIEAVQTDQSMQSHHDEASGRVVIDVHDLGIWYRRHNRKRLPSLKRALLKWDWSYGPEGTFWALKHISFKAYEGQTLGIIGPNGAGKSTLCLALSGILEPDEGAITAHASVSALLALGAGFNRDLSGRANIMLNAAFLGIARKDIEAKMDDIIEFSELGSFIDEPIRVYSKGMRSRLSFSVAAALKPEVLILDEVLSVGDRKFRIKSQQRLQEMMSESKLIVVVSHSMAFLREVCTHCLWIEKGQMRQIGEAQSVIKAYKTEMGGTNAKIVEDDLDD